MEWTQSITHSLFLNLKEKVLQSSISFTYWSQRTQNKISIYLAVKLVI